MTGLELFEQARDDYLAALRIDPDFAVAHSELALLAATTSHVECTAEERAAMGIPENLVRYSVGIEDADDLIAFIAAGFGEPA